MKLFWWVQQHSGSWKRTHEGLSNDREVSRRVQVGGEEAALAAQRLMEFAAGQLILSQK